MVALARELTKPPLSARTSKQNGNRNASRRHPNLIQAFGHGHLGMILTAGTSRIVASPHRRSNRRFRLVGVPTGSIRMRYFARLCRRPVGYQVRH